MCGAKTASRCRGFGLGGTVLMPMLVRVVGVFVGAIVVCFWGMGKFLEDILGTCVWYGEDYRKNVVD